MLKIYKKLSLALLFVCCGVVSAQDYTSTVKDYLVKNTSKFNVSATDVSDMKVYNQSYNKKAKVTHVYAVQRVGGIEVYNAVVTAAIKDGQVFYASSNMTANLSTKINGQSPSLNPIQAAASAATKLGLGNGTFSIQSAISSQEYLLNNGGVSLEDVPVKLVYQPVGETLKLAWDLSIHTLDTSHWYSVRIDANSGEILDQIDWVQSCSFETHNHTQKIERNDSEAFSGVLDKDTSVSSLLLADEVYNVYPLPVESPAHGNRALVVEPQDLNASPFGWHDLDGVEGAEVTITRGNNVWAQEDRNDNNGTGESPDGGDDLVFDYDLDLTLDPVDNLDAITTNLFYWNNILHDVFYYYGFDEASGNFQFLNYSGDGLGNDFVFADSQDSLVNFGTPFNDNNANFSTPPDGNHGRMQMFLFSESSVPTFEVNSPSSVSGFYGFSSAQFGEAFPLDGLSGNLVLAEDDDTSGDINDACDPLTNNDELDGNIAVVRRGACDFTVKVKAAQDAGAIAVVVVNNVSTPIINLGGDDATVTIPSGMISQTEGNNLLEALENGDTVNVTITGAELTRKDGSLDNGIIAHEYGHGISTRLTGGAGNSGCLGNAEQMGEGWSDYFGLILTIEPGDTAEDIRGIGTYATGQPITGTGIRPAAYSTDTTINDLTYGDTNNEAAISQPHGIGTVWSTMLWDLTWVLIDEYGYDEDIYNGDGGNNIALQLVVDGLKLQPCGTGFVSGRDAIIAAVDINDDIADADKISVKCMLWDVFAARGLGFSASQGSAGSRTDQVEAFDTPPSDVLNCNLSVGDVNSNIFKVYPNPSNGNINISIAQAQGEGSVTIYDINGRQVFTQKVSLEGTVNVQAQGLSTGIYILEINGASASQTTKLIIE